MNIRKVIEEREKQFLSPYAQLSINSKGRERPEDPGPLRTCYQHDRDRIIHCKSFRRLKHKTQVFLAPEGDHYRTRLTHTLEVSQIARTIARALFLNEDLTEAIALGHDLGHTPFGHTGEEAFTKEFIGWQFEHNKQSKRVVEVLERDGKGLNLTWEVRDGIEKHVEEETPATLEGKVVRLADWIAYINHDIDDAIRADILKENALPKKEIEVLGKTGGGRINAMVTDIVENSLGKNDIVMSPQIYQAMEGLKFFLFKKVYIDSEAKVEEKKAIDLLKSLYRYYLENPQALPKEYRKGKEDLSVRVVDYIAGMSDRFALKEYERIFLPQVWKV